MNVSEIIRSLRCEPNKHRLDPMTDRGYTLLWNKETGENIYKIPLFDELRLRYAIWRWKCNQNKMFEWYVDDDGLPYLRKLKKAKR